MRGGLYNPFKKSPPPPPPPPPSTVTSSNVAAVTDARNAAAQNVTAASPRNLTPQDVAAAESAKIQGVQRAAQSRKAQVREAALATGTKLAIIGAVASTVASGTKAIPVVGGAIAGAIMLIHMAIENDIRDQQAKAEAKDIQHDLTYSYLLFKLIDLGADRLKLVLNTEIIEEGIKDINEKIHAKLRPTQGRISRALFSNSKLELEELHKSARDFRDNMTQLYTSFDVLKKTDDLLTTLTNKDKPGQRYKGISDDAIKTLISWYSTAAARDLDDSEVSEVMKFLATKLMTPAEANIESALVNGDTSPLNELDKPSPPPLPAEAGGALWPPKYYRGLSTRRKGQRRREITRRAKMSWKNPAAYRP